MGLAAYILEKFIDRRGNFTKIFTMDSLLDNVMIYWVTNSMTTAIRLYAATYNKKVSSLHMDRYKKLNWYSDKHQFCCCHEIENFAIFSLTNTFSEFQYLCLLVTRDLWTMLFILLKLCWSTNIRNWYKFLIWKEVILQLWNAPKL